MKEKQKELEKANTEISKINEEITMANEESFHSQKNKILHALKQLNNDGLTKDLNLQITKSNQDFFEKLSLNFPNLTQNELRLCALLKMNLNTKEIANLTFKNAQSVKVARSRLRKKLGLTHNKMAISVFLNQL